MRITVYLVFHQLFLWIPVNKKSFSISPKKIANKTFPVQPILKAVIKMAVNGTKTAWDIIAPKKLSKSLFLNNLGL